MSELKTKVTTASVTDFINAITDLTKRNDSFRLVEIYEEVTGEKAKMWGPSIVGFGMYHYKSERSSQEGDWPLAAFSPRKAGLTLYVMAGSDYQQKPLEKLGKYKVSGSCLHIKTLAEVDENVLKEIIKNCLDETKKIYP